MHAVTFVDGVVTWSEQPDPTPGFGEVRIDVRAAGLNSGDLLQQRGLYPAPPGVSPDIPGLEVAGIVDQCGVGVTDFAVGDRVMALVAGGGQAQLVVVHERCVMRVPDVMSWDEAGAFPEAFITAHDALFTQCGLTIGERVAVNAAAGGVGTAAVQLAVAAGATTIASVRDPKRREDVAGLGAIVIDPDAFPTAGPYDVILELVGGPQLDADVKALSTGGRIVVIGVGAGAKGHVNLLALMAARGSIHASTLRARPLDEKGIALRAVASKVLPLVEAGTVHVPICATFPMDEAAQAYEFFAAGGKFGKIVLISP